MLMILKENFIEQVRKSEIQKNVNTKKNKF